MGGFLQQSNGRDQSAKRYLADHILIIKKLIFWFINHLSDHKTAPNRHVDIETTFPWCHQFCHVDPLAVKVIKEKLIQSVKKKDWTWQF